MASEKRLIDANKADVEKISCYYGSNCDLDDVQSWLDEQPTVDAVEVVRCKDCKHWTMGYCNHFAYYDYEPLTNEDDFCSYGERKDND